MTKRLTCAALCRRAWTLPLLAGMAAPAAAEYRPVTAETAVDLSPTVSMAHKQYYPGGRHHQPVIVNYITPGPGLLAADFDRSRYGDEERGWLQEFERQHGRLKETDRTADKVPVHWLMGPARVVDVRHLVGTTDEASWPASPAITVEHVKAHEQAYGPIEAGQVVVFNTGHTDTHFRAFERGRIDEVMKGPLDGETEGWPAPTAEVIQYLAGKGVRHVAIDAPIMGSVDPKERAFTYWAGVNNDMVFSEYLMDVGTLPPRGAFYIFLHPKIENTHGGPGRAIAILPIGKRMQKQASLQP